MDRLRSSLPAAPAPRRAVTVAALALACASMLAYAAPAAAGPSAADVARARELYTKGKTAYRAGDMRVAYESYAAAWALQKTFDVAANLAGVELATARFRDAAEHLAFALANLPVSGDADKQRPVLLGMLGDAKKQLGTLTIRVTVNGADLTLDGRSLGTSPVSDDVFVEPGEHIVVATAPGFTSAEQKLRIEKGAAAPVTLVLKKVVVRPVSTAPSPITIAGFITAGLGLGAGTALAIVSKIKADDADTQFQALQAMHPGAATPCAGQKPSTACTSLHDARAGRDTFANAALWTFVGAGAVAAGTVVYTFVLPRFTAAKTTGIMAVPIVSPEGGGFVVKGSF